MADHPSCYSKATHRVTTREARHLNQLPATSRGTEQPPCSKKSSKHSSKEKQGVSEEQKSSTRKSRRDQSRTTSSDSPISKRRKPDASVRNLSSSSSRHSARSSSESNEEVSQIFSSDKRSSLRSNPKASLLEGLAFTTRRRSTSAKGKATASKSKDHTNRSPSESQSIGKRRTRSGANQDDQSKAKPLKIRLLPSENSDEPGTSRTQKTSRQATKSREGSRSSNRAQATESDQLLDRPTRGKRKLPAASSSTTQEAPAGNEGVSEKIARKASTQRKSSKKPPGATQSNTGSCASTSRRRAASKEGGRLRSTNSSLLSNSASSYNLPNATGMSNDGRQFPNPGNASMGDSAEGGTINTDNAEAGTSSVGSFATSLSFEQDSDVGRLQALLEARGVPSHLFGTLGPRMHQILQRTVLGSSVYKVQVILQNLQSKDENQQLSAAIEMCQLLVMGNEDTLAGFPTRQVVPALIALLKGNPLDDMGTNFDVMHHACRALTYMMEALPRSSSVVVDAVPVFLEKLQSIQCMDVAEQSLQALEMLSKKHHKAILHANGVSSCLMFLDFFSLPAQRTAVSITANCCQNLNQEEFNFVRSSLPTLSNLLIQQDKKLLESVCLSLSRLVENFHSDESIMREVAADGFLNNTLELLMATPSLISSTMFVTVVHMLATMCSTCPDLAVQLLNLKIADALCSMLVTMNQGASLNIELTPRTPQELYEIVCLIGELMPKLPTEGIFSVDQLLKKSYGNSTDGVSWQWLDDHGVWHQYTVADCRIIEAALQAGEREVNLCIFGVNYTIDFESLQQINEDTGTTRHVKRKANNIHNNLHQVTQQSKVDAREMALKSTPELGDYFIKTLFCVLYEVYNSSAGSSIRHKCLQAIMRIIYYGNAEPLKSVLPMCNVSSHIAAMMASSDLKIVVASIQMAFILVEKLPEIFNVHFCREGVMHQIKKLRDLPATSSSTSLVTPEQQPSHPSATHPLPPEVMDLSTATSSSLPQQQQLHPVILSTPMNTNNNNNGGSYPIVPGPGRITRSGGYANQPLLSNLMPPPQQASAAFRQSFLHIPPHLTAPYTSLPSPPPPYPSFHVFQEPTIDFPPPPPLPPTHPFQMGGTMDAGSLALGPTGRSSPVSPKLKISNVLKHKKVSSSRKISGGKSGRGVAFSHPSSVPPNPINPASAGVGLIMGSSQQPPQILPMPGFYPPGQTAGQPFTPSELHGLLGDVDHTSHLRQNRWNNAAKPANFLHGLKWNRSSNRQMDRPASPLPQSMMVVPGHHLSNHQQLFQTPAFSVPPPTMVTPPSAPSETREKVRQWICEQATKFCEKYYGEQGANNTAISALSCLNQLCAANTLLLDEKSGIEGLKELSRIMMEEDVSPFEMIHSGILDSLLTFLTPNSKSAPKFDPKSTDAEMILKYERAKTFLNVFLKNPMRVTEGSSGMNTDDMDTRPFQSIVAKLMACFHHLEQFQVKVHDLPAGSSLSRGGNNAIRFFDTHQIKCNLQRHPSCTTLKQWKGGPVKIDPLALVQAIERYLLMRGFARVRQIGDDDDDDDEEASDDEEIEEGLTMPSTSNNPTPTTTTLVTGSGSRRQQQQQQQSSQQQHNIEFVLNDQVLPYNMTVYEAVRQFGNQSNLGRTPGAGPGLEGEVEGEWEGTLGANCIWTNTHTIYYRPATEGLQKPAQAPVADVAVSPKKTKTDKLKNKGGTKAIKELDLSRCSSLDQALDLQISSHLTFKDPSLKILPLLSILNALNRYWGVLFEKLNAAPLLANQEFLSSKLTSKANRQLQDPLSIMTGNLPPWLGQIARTCSFLLPFETRQLLFYATAFDRERAMHRVQRESNQDQGSSSENNDRVVPRLERRKATISRDDVLRQAEKLIGDMSNFKALLEIQYDNEVGTGLGPTMEFYALVSKELQRHDLDLWNGEPTSSSEEDSTKENQIQYMFNSCGLFPAPIQKSMRAAQVNKLKSKFKFLGKFMAKALMDSRMLDLPLSKSLYKWMLNSANNNGRPNLCLSDIDNVLPMMSKFVQQLLDILRQKKTIEADQSHTTESRSLALNSLTLDGCSFEDVGIDFCLPGSSNIEMKRGGKDVLLSLNNIEEYLKLLVHWTMHEGPGKQLEALKEGFESIFPMSQLSLFYPEEMEMLFCGNNFEPWTIRYLSECCRVDHGYSMDSQPIRFLFEVLSTFDAEQQRLFVQFTTGSPKLPVGGLKSLNPPLTIVRKSVENNDNPDHFLPSVMTCVNYFKLPEYTNIDVIREKLLLAVQEGQKSFHLS